MPSPLSRIDAFLGCPSGSCRQPPSVSCAGGTLWGSAPRDVGERAPCGAQHPMTPPCTDQDLHCEHPFTSPQCVPPQPSQSPTFPPHTLTRICTVSSPSPASRASMVNSTGRLAGIPPALSPGPLARTLLASWVGSAVTLKGLGEAGSQEGAGISRLCGDPVPPSAHPRRGLTCVAPPAPHT